MDGEGEPFLSRQVFSLNTHQFASEGSHEHLLFTVIIVVVLIAVNYKTIIAMTAAGFTSSEKCENDVQFLPVGAGLFLSC